MRRDRIYKLSLVRPDHDPTVLAELRFDEEQTVPSQQMYRVAPGGRWLAYASRHGQLRLRDVEGHDTAVAGGFIDFRFSADGRWLAVAGRAPGDSDLILFDLSGSKPVARSLGSLPWITRIEWSADGIVVEQLRITNRLEQRLRLVSTTGEYHVVYEGGFDAFASAARGHRAIVVSFGDVREFDLAKPEQPPRVTATDLVGRIDQKLTYAEMSADGEQVLLATDRELFAVDRNGRTRRVSAQHVTAIWPADDGGRMVWLDDAGMHVGGADAPTRLSGRFTSVRFRRDQPGLIGVLRGNALLWDSEGQNPRSVWRAQDAELVGADAFAGGVVVWTATTAPFDSPGPSR